MEKGIRLCQNPTLALSRFAASCIISELSVLVLSSEVVFPSVTDSGLLCSAEVGLEGSMIDSSKLCAVAGLVTAVLGLSASDVLGLTSGSGWKTGFSFPSIGGLI